MCAGKAWVSLHRVREEVSRQFVVLLVEAVHMPESAMEEDQASKCSVGTFAPARPQKAV